MAVVKEDYNAAGAQEMTVFAKDRLLLKKRKRVNDVSGYDCLANDGTTGFVAESNLDSFTPAELSYRVCTSDS